nr:hypothetical protein [Tanacetum cinerariifolium]
PSSEARLISKRVANQEETPSLDNILSLTNRFKDILGIESSTDEAIGVEADKVWSLVDCPKGVRPIRTKQEEGIYYDEVFTPVARNEPIRLFLAYASFMGFTVYQMDVKSAFLYGTIDEEVYVMQPPGFQNPEGTIDQTLFIIRQRGNFILVQVYVDDIIFGSSNPQLCREFEALMHEKFQMSAMGELNFFLGLQVLQKKDSIFLSQDKYMGDILKKFGYSDVRSSNTPIDKEHPWGKDDSPFDLVAYSDCDYGGASQDRKSTSGGCQFLGRWLISWQRKKQTIVATSTTEAEYVAAASCCGQVL